MRAERFDEATLLAGLAVDLAERSGSALHRANAAVNRGFLASLLGDSTQSLQEVERAMRVAPPDYVDGAVLANNYACALIEMGRHEEALAVLRVALDRRPGNRDRWGLAVSLVEALIHADAWAEAREIARQLREELIREPFHGPARQCLHDLDKVVEQIEHGT